MNSTRILLRRPGIVRPHPSVALGRRAAWRRSSSTGQNGPALPFLPQTPKVEGPEEGFEGQPPPPRGLRGWLPLVGVFGLTTLGTSYYLLRTDGQKHVEEPRPKKRRSKSKPQADAVSGAEVAVQDAEQARDLLISQQAQVTKSWENPGVWVWGDNAGKVADPYSIGADAAVKSPRRLAFFDGQILRDLRLKRDFGVAVTEKGDIVQWGLGFSGDPRPAATLTGKNIVKAEVSADRVVALAANGAVYTLPVSQADQESGAKPVESAKTSGWGLWSSSPVSPPPSKVAYRTATPQGLGGRERVVDISSGREHCLMLTSSGRVFAAASSTHSFPSRGQLGMPGLSWIRRPANVPYDSAHEIAALKDQHVVSIATGESHSVAMDKQGQVWAWGDNTFGQLGYENEMAYAVADAPRKINIEGLYKGTGLVPRVTSIAAGGTNTFFTTDCSTQDHPKLMVAELWACGQGVHGQLGNGKWAHVGGTPSRIMALSALTEFDERTKKLVPIRLSALSVGATHTGAVMANETQASSTSTGPGNAGDIKWGSDVMVWGGNEHFQLGTGKRCNSNKPVYIAPMVDSGNGAGSSSHVVADKDARLQLAPRSVANIGGRKVSTEQRIVCGEYVTAVYSAA